MRLCKKSELMELGCIKDQGNSPMQCMHVCMAEISPWCTTIEKASMLGDIEYRVHSARAEKIREE